MEVIQKGPEKLVIRMEANVSLTNAIRRSVSEIPILAIEDVEMFKNDSALYDEILAHRFGLIPLKTEKSMSAKTKIDLKLTKIGPCTVYSGDLKGNADIVYDKIPLTILGDDSDKIELVATAKLGKGTDHAKHVPGLCFYRHILEVKSSPQIDSIIQGSKGLIKAEKKGNKWICDLNETEIDEITKLDKGAISDSEEILFIIESFGMLPAKDILIKAIESLEDNLDEFEKAL